MKALLCALLLSLSAAPARAEDSVLLKALGDELSRSMRRLDMDGLGKPHFLSYDASDADVLYLDASLGSLRADQRYRQRRLRVDLRVGSAAFDNYNYVGGDYWRYRPWVRDLAVEDDYGALRYGAWSLTDDAYKYALQKLSEKRAYKQARMIADEPPDLSLEPSAPVPVEAVPLERIEQSTWEARVRELSAVFKAYPGLQGSGAVADFNAGRRSFTDSEGRAFEAPDGDFLVTLMAWTQAADGLPLYDERSFAARAPYGLPGQDEMKAEGERLGRDLTALSSAPVMGDYVGPVLLEGQAAAEFFNQLLARGVSSPRAPWFEQEERKKDYGSGGLATRLGLRVAAPLLSAVDDPGLESYEGRPLFGSYRVDDEGVRAERVLVVEKGILKDLLMSRAPVKERPRSNGHGRAGYQEMVSGRLGNLLVSAEGAVPLAELRKALLQRASDFGLDYGMVIRRIAAEDRKEEGELLSAPVLAYKVYVKDGREELVRGAEFSGVTLRALRDVAAASRERYVYNFYNEGPFLGARGEVAASIVCPSVLLSELELKKTKKKPEKPPYLPSPAATR